MGWYKMMIESQMKRGDPKPILCNVSDVRYTNRWYDEMMWCTDKSRMIVKGQADSDPVYYVSRWVLSVQKQS